MGIFDGFFGDKPDGAGSSTGSGVNALFSDPIFMSGLKILENGLQRRPISQARSPLEGVPAMLAKLGEGQQELEGLRALAIQAGYTPEQAAKFTTPLQVKMALEQKTSANADAALAKAANGPSMFGGGASSPAAAGKSSEAGSSASVKMATVDPTLSDIEPEQKALLNAIAGPESNGKYNIRYTPKGGATFDDLSKHPAIFEPGPAGPSSAAGRYQFTKTTWDSLPAEVKGDGSFSPENQDRAALFLAQRDYGARTGRDLFADIKTKGFTPDIAKALGPTWTGLKDNPQVATNAYQQSLQRYAAPKEGQGQGLSRLADNQVTPPAPGVPVASRGPGGLAYAPPQADGFSSPLSSVLLNPQEMSAQAVQRGTPPGDPASYASTAPARPMPAGVDPASLAQPAVQQGRVQVASSDPNFVPGGAAPDDPALKPATIAEGKKAVAATPPRQPNPNVGASTQRAQAIQVFNHWSRVLPIAGRYGEKGKGLMEQAKQEMELAKEFLKPTDIEKLIEARRNADPAAAAMIERAMPDTRDPEVKRYEYGQKDPKFTAFLDRNQPDRGVRPLVTPEERAAAGIPARDTGVYQVDANGKISAVGTPKTEVNVDLKGENAFETEFNKKVADRWSGYLTQGDKATALMGDVGRLRELSGLIGQPGKRADLMLALGPYATALDIKMDGLSDLQAFNSIVQRMAPQLHTPGSGATSDIEFKGMLRAIGDPSLTQEARNSIFDSFEAMARNDQTRAEIATKLATKEITRTEAEKAIRALPDPLTAFREAQKAKGQRVDAGEAKPDPKADAAKPREFPANAPRLQRKADFDALPSGSPWIDLDGKQHWKP